MQQRVTASMTLFELNELVRGVLDLQLCTTYKVVAEIASLREAANGHCYLELIERNEHKGLVAKAAAHIWRSNYMLLATEFKALTGMVLSDGLKVLVEVAVEFHPLYGYSLNILDIDPSYTLGDMARNRKEIIEQLREDGVLHLNKEIEMSFPTFRIAVISSATAAGYGDFCQQLNQSPYKFHTQLFSAIMQGKGVEESIVQALNDIYIAISEKGEKYDAVVIIRGGGATSDLSDFDSYALASNVAQYPIAILTGIGHERDTTVLDAVAHESFKTPTAVAAYLVERADSAYSLLVDTEQRLRYSVLHMLESYKSKYQMLTHNYSRVMRTFAQREEQRLNRYSLQLSALSRNILTKQEISLEQLKHKIGHSLILTLQQEYAKIDALTTALRMVSPERILKMGYTMTCVGTKVIRSAAELQKGDTVTSVFYDGKRESKIIK